jgi:hypothetical protein
MEVDEIDEVPTLQAKEKERAKLQRIIVNQP